MFWVLKRTVSFEFQQHNTTTCDFEQCGIFFSSVDSEDELTLVNVYVDLVVFTRIAGTS